jgi:dihydrodipicolinate synthase/N-acetylneuraminate lyase
MSNPPPQGIYVPAVLFFKENEELDEEAIKSHVLRLAQVPTLDLIFTFAPSL